MSKSNFASARAFVARAVPVKITTAQASKPLHTSSAQTTLRLRSDDPTTRNQRRLINQVMYQLDAEEEKGDEKVPEPVKSDDDQDDIPDLESIPSDDEEQSPNYSGCKLTNFDWAPASAIYDMHHTQMHNFL